MGRHSKPEPEDSADEGSEKPRYDDTDAGDRPGYGEPAYPKAEAERGGAQPPFTPSASRRHRGDWDGEWTGSHRAVAGGRRGVSIGVIAALVAVVVVVGAVILWRFFGDALSDRSDAAAARCVAGELAVAVVADPSIAEQVQTLANNYNETASPVGDRCVAVGVKPADSDQVVNGFVSNWPTDLGERPALWIPASSVSSARLEAAAGAQTVSDSRSLVTSPVLLAARPELKDALAQQNWWTLPGLQTNPTALDELDLPGWGSLRLALPLDGNSDASYLAAEAVAAESAPSGAPASAGAGAVTTLVTGQPKLADNKAGTAMDALLSAGNPAAAPVHAVVTTEQQLYQRASSLPDAKNTVASWLPPGPTATADYPTVLLSGNWLSQEQVAAASEFARFLRKPEQLAELAKAGFRTDGGTPPKSDVTSFDPVSAPLSIGDNATRVTLADALTTSGPTSSIMVDLAMTTEEGGRTRLANAIAVLETRIKALPPTAAIGLTTFDGSASTTMVTVGPLSEQLDGQPRSEVLTTSLDGLQSNDGGSVSFTTLRNVYTEAVTNFRPGQRNSVLVILGGAHTDQSLDGDGLQAVIREAADPDRPVAINIIDFGAESDRATWEAVARISGGSYQNLPTSASPELATTVARLLK
jgi:hypothetical protein